MSFSVNFNQIDGEDVSSLYKGVKSEHLPNVNSKTIYYGNTEYHLCKYVKENLNRDNVLTTGLFRSVIARDGKVLAVSPAKTMEYSHFTETYEEKDCVMEEFVEGTMCNVFYDKDEWVISTKSNIGAKNSFFTKGHISPEDTFQQMFLDAFNYAGLSFDNLSSEYQYSFVLQHPRNRIVLDIKVPKLYLIAVNQISDDNLVTNMRDVAIEFVKTNKNVKMPDVYNYEGLTFKDIENEWKNDIKYTEMGLVIVHKSTGNRTKIRNPNYEYVKVLRGNQPKLEFRYFELWQENRIEEYLKYYPECKDLFVEYWNKLCKFMDLTFNHYVDCYMLKRFALKEYPFEYRTHMYALHTLYKEKLRDNRQIVTVPVTVEYFRSLPVAKIMFSLNYNMRPKTDVGSETAAETA